MKKYWLLAFSLMLLCLALSGCWDRAELQERMFILGIAIDKGEKEESFYQVSIQVLDIQPNMGSEGGRSKAKTDTYIITEEGRSIAAILRKMLQQTDRKLWFDNVQIVVISEEALQQGGLCQLLDYIVREKEFRLGIKGFVTRGKAKKILEFKPFCGTPGGMFLENITDFVGKNPHLEGQMLDVKAYIENRDNQEVFGFSKVELEGETLKINGLAAMNSQGTLVGYLDEYAVKGSNFLTGKVKSGVISFACPVHPEHIVVVEIDKNQRNLTATVEGENIGFTLESTLWARLGEVQCACLHPTDQREYLAEAEDLVRQEVERNINYTFARYQQLGWDHNLFSQTVQRQYPLEWDKVKEHWATENFPKTTLTLKTHVHVENIGNHK